MFKQDEYNQEEYNDYYRQEVEGAELNGFVAEKESGGGKKFIILLILLALGVAGYFGYKNFYTSSDESNEIDKSLQVSMDSLPQSVQQEEEPEKISEIKEEVKTEVAQPEVQIHEVSEEASIKEESSNQDTSIESTIVKEVQKSIPNSGKMSPEEVASIVATVMQQMNQSKVNTPNQVETVSEKQDAELIEKLAEEDVSSISEDLIKELENINLNQNTHIDSSSNKKQVDVYNKVNVQNSSGNDILSQLSNEINDVINEGIVINNAKSYTESLKNEVSVRQNEMRIIVVKAGDTLGKLARRAYGNSMEYKKIYQANPELTQPDRIYVGQKLRIPN